MRLEVSAGSKYRSQLSIASEPAQVLLASNDKKLIRMVADGVSPRVIAQRLGIRETEVRASLDSIFEKLATSGRLKLLSRKVT